MSNKHHNNIISCY